MKQLIILSLLLFLSIQNLNACLNFYAINENGEGDYHYEHYPPNINVVNTNKHDYKILKRLSRRIKRGDKSFKNVSNYGAYLIKLGKTREALSIFKLLYHQKPEEYNIIGNLAVAFEVNNEFDSAYFYLKKALDINPHAHHNSEWFHLQILEKYIQQQNGTFDTNHKVLNLMDSSRIKAFNTDYNCNDSIHSIRLQAAIGNQLAHQLEERLPLTKAPNLILSKALEETGDHFKKHISITWALEYYAIAIAYSPDENEKARLWKKIEATRNRIVALYKKNERILSDKNHGVRKDLPKSTWKTNIERDIKKWSVYNPNYYKNFKFLTAKYIFNG